MTAHFLSDGLQSLATRLGTPYDKAATASYTMSLLDDQQLETAFRTSWVAKKLVDIPAADATRKWRKWNGPRAAQVQEYEFARRIKLQQKVYEADWKARLFGGAAILIGVDSSDWSEPLDPSSVGPGALKYLTVLTRHDLNAGVIEDDPREERFGKPRYYDIMTASAANPGLFRVHPSRLVEFVGRQLPRWNTGGSGAYGWGDSVLQAAYEACRNLDSTMANIASLVFEAKTDVVHIPDLSANISDLKYEEALLRRFTTARMLKGNNGTLILDGEEKYDTKSFTFSGLDVISDRFMQIVSGAADIPLTRFLGTSPAGQNSTGESDLSNYYDMIGSRQVNTLQTAMASLDEILCRSARANWNSHDYEWLPLWQLSEKEMAEVREYNATTVSMLSGAGLYPPQAVADLGARLFQDTGVDNLNNQVAREPVQPVQGESGNGPDPLR